MDAATAGEVVPAALDAVVMRLTESNPKSDMTAPRRRLRLWSKWPSAKVSCRPSHPPNFPRRQRDDVCCQGPSHPGRRLYGSHCIKRASRPFGRVIRKSVADPGGGHSPSARRTSGPATCYGATDSQDRSSGKYRAKDYGTARILSLRTEAVCNSGSERTFLLICRTYHSPSFAGSGGFVVLLIARLFR